MESSHYSLDVVVRVEALGDVIKLLSKRGTLVRVTPHNISNGNGSNRRPYVPPKIKTGVREARDVVFNILKAQRRKAVARKFITKALVAKGYSARSIGPICTLLQRDGIIFSPRRGYWQVK